MVNRIEEVIVIIVQQHETSDLFVKIKVEDLANQVYARLKKAITMNVIQPGERIDINLLADQWGVSRTPMKDAISKLANEGFVEVRSKVGTYATQFTKKDMLELYAIRLVLEVGATEEMLMHATAEQIKELEAIQNALEQEVAKLNRDFDFFRFNYFDALFHETCIALTGNHKLLDMYRSLNFHNQVARYFYNFYEHRSLQTIQDHRKIVDALRKKSLEPLKEIIQFHILTGKQRLDQFVQKEEHADDAL